MNKKKGKQGENIAVAYLKRKNYEILNLNFYTPYGEIDIIARDNKVLVFVEVKLRKNESYGHVLEQLKEKQKERIIYSAQHYLEQNELYATDCRFDYIALYDNLGELELNHIENAF